MNCNVEWDGPILTYITLVLPFTVADLGFTQWLAIVRVVICTNYASCILSRLIWIPVKNVPHPCNHTYKLSANLIIGQFLYYALYQKC